MKAKGKVIGILIAVFVLIIISYDSGRADQKAEIAPAKIAVVSIEKVFEGNEKHHKWQQSMEARQVQIQAELQQMLKEIESIKSQMDTRKLGSSDYLKLAQEGMEKRAVLEAKDKFYEQEVTIKIKQWTEELYKEVIAATNKVATEKGLDLVLARENFDSATATTADLMTMIRTNKVLFHANEMDITDDVLAALNENK